MSSELNNATNGEIALVREWLESIHPLAYRLTSEEIEETATQLAHHIFGLVKHETAELNKILDKFCYLARDPRSRVIIRNAIAAIQKESKS